MGCRTQCDRQSARTHDHPVIAQNLFRLKNGPGGVIGMSWLKHGFFSTNQVSGACSGIGGQTCRTPPAGSAQLGIGCTAAYSSSLNGSQPLGPRSQVNGTTGIFPFPPTSPNGP